jgi:lysozyme
MALRKKRRTKNNYATLGVMVFLTLLVYGLWRWSEAHKAQFVHYEAFGIEIPVEYSIHGIDVSRYQKDIDWEEVKTMKVQNISLGFAFIKATDGDSNPDPYFYKNWREAHKNKIIRGAYHYFQPDKNATQQARLFMNYVKILPGDLPPVLDVEAISNLDAPALQKRMKTWLAIIESHYGYKPIIYTNADFYTKYLEGQFDEYPLWVAHYYEQHKPRIKRNWVFWQHNDRGNVNGIASKVDFNVYNGDSASFSSLLVK